MNAAKDQVCLTREFLDEQYMYRLMNMETHPKVGDLAIVKMLEVGYKRTGDIQPARISAEAKAVTGDSQTIYARRLYLPEWRKQAIEQAKAMERAQLANGQSSNPVRNS